MKQVIGSIDANGKVISGDCFQAERHSKGLYKVYFNTGLLEGKPVVLVTPDTSNQSSETYTVAVSLKSVSETGFTLSIENLSANTIDAGFNFLAIVG